MADVSPDKGTLIFAAPPATAGDLRYYPARTNAADYDTVADASFRSGKCHNFTDITENHHMRFTLPRVDGLSMTDVISLAIGEEVRWYYELECTMNVASNNFFGLFAGGLSCQVAGYFKASGGVFYFYHIITDTNNNSTTTADVQLNAVSSTAEYHKPELRFKRTATDTYELEVRLDSVTQNTTTHTVTGADKTFKFGQALLGNGGDGTKSATCNYKFVDFHMSWNAGVTRRDQQFFTVWNPTISAVSHPDADVDATDFTGVGDTTNRFQNVNDDPAVFTTYDLTTSVMTELDLLLGWPAIGTLGAEPVVIVLNQEYVPALGGNMTQYLYAKNATTTDNSLAQTKVQGANTASPAYTQVGVFVDDPDGVALSESIIDAMDFGVRKPATGAGTLGRTSQLWRYVLHGGNAIPATRRRSGQVV